MQFSKPIIAYQDQVDLLKSRGLVITDNSRALHILSNISYYRLSGYWYPLLSIPKENHEFKPKASFKDAFDLYCFDRELRKLILAELEKIEVGVKTKIIHTLTPLHGAFWYADLNLFKSQSYSSLFDSIMREYDRCDEVFIKHFKNKYKAEQYPPCWIMFEIVSFGTLSKLYQSLKDIDGRIEIPRSFGLDQTTFVSWLRCLVFLRNVCAHHLRVWNRKMKITGIIPVRPKNLWIRDSSYLDEAGTSYGLNDKIYFYLSIMVYFLNIINPRHTVKKKIKELFLKYSNVDIKAMGFPLDWEEDPFWQLKEYKIKIGLEFIPSL